MSSGSDAQHVFVCYAHADFAVVAPLLDWLRNEAISIWYDDGIRPGRAWTEEIADALNSASHVLFFASPRSVDSRHCRNEVHYATRQEKPIITVFLEPMDLPPGLELELSLHQGIHAHAEPERFGDRILSALGEESATGSANTPAITTTAQQTFEPPENSVAVLPFRNLSPDPEDVYFSDGVADEILDRIARFSRLRVTARSSAFRYRDDGLDVRTVGRELGTRFLLEGTVRRAAQRVRVHTQLSDTRDGVQLWTERFDGDLQDLFDLQDQIADAVITSLRESRALPIDAAEPTRDERKPKLDAHDALLRAIHARDRSDSMTAIACCEDATRIDPYYSDAWAHLAENCLAAFANMRGDLKTSVEYLPRALEAAETSWQLDQNSPMANRIMSTARLYALEWTTAQRFALRAVQLKPNEPNALLNLAQVLRSTGRAEQAMPYVRWAETVDPLSPHQAFKAWTLIDTRRFAQARAVSEAALAGTSGPNEHYIQLTATFGGEGNFERVIHYQSRPEFPLPDIRFSDAWAERLRRALADGGRRGYFQAYLQWVLERKAESATFILDTFLTWAYGELGYLDEAFVQLEFVATGSFIPEQYFYDALRADPRWQAFLEKRGLNAEAVAALEQEAERYKAEIGFPDAATNVAA